LQATENLLESPASAPRHCAAAPFGRARLASLEMPVRRLLPLLLGGALLGVSSSAALAQNMCSPSTAPTTRYPAYPGSTPYSGNTIQVTSNCTGPAVDPGIRPDPFADPDSLPLPTGSGASATSPPSADPATLYAPTGPSASAAPATMPMAPGPPSAVRGVPPGSGGMPGQAPAGVAQGYAAGPGVAPPQGAAGQYPGYAADPSTAASDPTAVGYAPPGVPAAPGMMPPGYPGMGFPMPGLGYPGQPPFPPGPGMPPGYPGMPPGPLPAYP
jgi:hypothetical protein